MSRGTQTYTIQISTGAISGAGTDANVYITLRGSNGRESNKILLDSYRDDFENGHVDTFTIDTVDLDEITNITLEHDNTGNAPGWYVEYVMITKPESRRKWVAPVYRWLAKDENDSRISITEECSAMPVEYQIAVRTGTASGAGTDANVYITIKGEQGEFGEILLDNDRDNFENGSYDVFTVTLPDLGGLTQIDIRHDNSGKNPGWYLDNVEITNLDNKKKWLFNCNGWLAKDEGDGRIYRTITAEK